MGFFFRLLLITSIFTLNVAASTSATNCFGFYEAKTTRLEVVLSRVKESISLFDFKKSKPSYDHSKFLNYVRDFETNNLAFYESKPEFSPELVMAIAEVTTRTFNRQHSIEDILISNDLRKKKKSLTKLIDDFLKKPITDQYDIQNLIVEIYIISNPKISDIFGNLNPISFLKNSVLKRVEVEFAVNGFFDAMKNLNLIGLDSEMKPAKEFYTKNKDLFHLPVSIALNTLTWTLFRIPFGVNEVSAIKRLDLDSKFKDEIINHGTDAVSVRLRSSLPLKLATAFDYSWDIFRKSIISWSMLIVASSSVNLANEVVSHPENIVTYYDLTTQFVQRAFLSRTDLIKAANEIPVEQIRRQRFESWLAAEESILSARPSEERIREKWLEYQNLPDSAFKLK